MKGLSLRKRTMQQSLRMFYDNFFLWKCKTFYFQTTPRSASCAWTSRRTRSVFLLAATQASAETAPDFCTPKKTPARSAEPRSTESLTSTINSEKWFSVFSSDFHFTFYFYSISILFQFFFLFFTFNTVLICFQLFI